jgi:hypothetical protein
MIFWQFAWGVVQHGHGIFSCFQRDYSQNTLKTHTENILSKKKRKIKHTRRTSASLMPILQITGSLIMEKL